jgi:hypothetical protein
MLDIDVVGVGLGVGSHGLVAGCGCVWLVLLPFGVLLLCAARV